MTMKKVFRGPIQLKADGPEGAFKSVFATLNVKDFHGDVTVPGAFAEGQRCVVEGWNHDYGLPPGMGTIHSNDKEAWIDGQFLLDTTSGKDHYLTLKALDGLEEWSYTFEVEESESGEFEDEPVRYLKAMDVWGVAPVTRGAGINTRTLALKSLDLSDEQLQEIKAWLKEHADGASDDALGGVSGDEGGEGEAGADGDGKPSGAPPSVILALIDSTITDTED